MVNVLVNHFRYFNQKKKKKRKEIKSILYAWQDQPKLLEFPDRCEHAPTTTHTTHQHNTSTHLNNTPEPLVSLRRPRRLVAHCDCAVQWPIRCVRLIVWLRRSEWIFFFVFLTTEYIYFFCFEYIWL